MFRRNFLGVAASFPLIGLLPFKKKGPEIRDFYLKPNNINRASSEFPNGFVEIRFLESIDSIYENEFTEKYFKLPLCKINKGASIDKKNVTYYMPEKKPKYLFRFIDKKNNTMAAIAHSHEQIFAFGRFGP